MKQSDNNYYDAVLEKLKNNKVIVVISITFIIIFGLSEILDTTVKIKNRFGDILGYTKLDSTKVALNSNNIQPKFSTKRPIDIIIFSPNNYSIDDVNTKKLISKILPNSHVTMAGANWFERQEFNESIIVYVKTEYKQVALDIEQLLPGHQSVQMYIPNKPFFGLEKRDIALFCGKELYK